MSERQGNWRIRIYISLIAIVIVSLVGPFSTYERFSLAERLLYWGGVIGFSLVPAHFIRISIRRRVQGSDLRRDMAAVMGVTIILTPLIWLANLFLLGGTLAHWTMFAEHFVSVWLICMVPALIRHYYRTLPREAPEPLPSESPGPPVAENPTANAQDVQHSPLHRHIDPSLMGPIKRVSANDHQTLIFTDKGETRVRMRFADALNQLGEAAGMRVHRSHWVAFDAIERLAQDGRRFHVTLCCGTVIPVSPARIADLGAAGILLSEE